MRSGVQRMVEPLEEMATEPPPVALVGLLGKAVQEMPLSRE